MADDPQIEDLPEEEIDESYHDDPELLVDIPRRNIFAGFAAFLMLLAGTSFYLPSTVGAKITISSGIAAIEFGQGSQLVGVCIPDATLTFTPKSQVINKAGSADVLFFKSFTVSNVPAACVERDFIFNFYDDTSSNPYQLFDAPLIDSRYARIYMSSSTSTDRFMPVNSKAFVVSKNSDTSFTVSFDDPMAYSANLYKLTLQTTAHDTAGKSWTLRTTPSGAWNAVTYGNGLFVAAGLGGAIITSPDGITWTRQTNSQIWNILDITYGNGIFVAIGGTTSNILTSSDGIAWTQRTTPTVASASWYSVTYGKNLFVVVNGSNTGNASGRVMTSPDGITWTTRTSVNDWWYGVAYGNGYFNATSYLGGSSPYKYSMISSDGFTWSTPANPPTGNNMNKISYGNGVFVAPQLGNQFSLYTSLNFGLTWALTTSALPSGCTANNAYVAPAFGNGIYAMVSTTSSLKSIATSTNATTWSCQDAPAVGRWSSITYGNGKFVAVSSYSTGVQQVMSSP